MSVGKPFCGKEPATAYVSCNMAAVQRLADVIAALPGLGPSSRVLDVGSGTGCLIAHLQARGVQDILAVDVSAAMVQQLQVLYPAPSSCGNDPGGDHIQLCSTATAAAAAKIRLSCLL